MENEQNRLDENQTEEGAVYFDFVLCEIIGAEDERGLYRAPAFSCLSSGDIVTVEDEYGEMPARVIACASFSSLETKKIDLIMHATNSPADVKRVTAKTIYQPFEYED